VKGHDFDNATFSKVFEATLRERLAGDLEGVKQRLDRFKNIFYLTDNSGEVVFDLFVIERLLEMHKDVVIGSKAEPILNDVTAEEVSAMTGIRVVPTGAAVGTALEMTGPEASSLLLDPEWLILSKGMGNFETISEYEEELKGRLIYLLRAKCEPVATALGVPRGALVVKLV
jgi:damage-control phosphatase, subfamily I